MIRFFALGIGEFACTDVVRSPGTPWSVLFLVQRRGAFNPVNFTESKGLELLSGLEKGEFVETSAAIKILYQT